MTTSKYRVTYMTFNEYVPYNKDYCTNVHTVMECDIVANTPHEAIQLAVKVFNLEERHERGDWKVRMLCSPYEKYGPSGSSPENSTLINQAKKY